MRYFSGKSQINKYVIVSPRNKEYSILFELENKEEAEKYYHNFDLEKEKLPIIQRIKLKLCKHFHRYHLDVGSTQFHYEFCPNCRKANYIDDETIEQKNERRIIMDKLSLACEINDLTNLIENLNKKKNKLNTLYEKKYGDDKGVGIDE